MSTILDSLIRHDLIAFREREAGYADEWVAYKQALRRVAELAPEGLGLNGITPLSRLDEAAVALCLAAWHAGSHVGAAFARAELSPESDRFVCKHCNGAGQREGEPDICLFCQGRGIIIANDAG